MTSKRRPFQVYLDEREADLLARAAEAAGTSKADVLRAAVRRLARDLVPPEDDPAWRLIGLASVDTESPGDLADRHDEYLARIDREGRTRGPTPGLARTADEDGGDG